MTAFVCDTKVGCIPPFTYRHSGDFSIPSYFSTHLGGKGCQGQGVWDAESVPPRQEEKDVLPPLGCSARPCDVGGCRGTQVGAGTRRTMRIWWPEDGSCQGDVPPSPQSFPCHFKYTFKHNRCIHCTALGLCCAPHLHRAKQCCPLRERTKSRLNILKYCQLLFKMIAIVFKCMFLSLFLFLSYRHIWCLYIL